MTCARPAACGRTAIPERRILLSPPDVGDEERRFLLAAFDSGLIAPAGPDVDAFEAEMTAHLTVPDLGGDRDEEGNRSDHTDHRAHRPQTSPTTPTSTPWRCPPARPPCTCRSPSPGSADDEVLCPTLTFATTANAIRYLGAKPVLVDAEPDTWTVDPELIVEELEQAAARDRLPAAIVTVDLCGHCADHDRFVADAVVDALG